MDRQTNVQEKLEAERENGKEKIRCSVSSSFMHLQSYTHTAITHSDGLFLIILLSIDELFSHQRKILAM